MTRIGVFSDTHGVLAALPRALELAGPLDGFLHLGDFGSDGDMIATQTGLPYHAVRGNCDFSSALPRQLVVTFEQANILMLHGDKYSSTYQLALLGEQNHCGAVLFGHTHTPLLAAQGPILLLNPGSLSRPRYTSDPSFGLLTIEGADVNAKIFTL